MAAEASQPFRSPPPEYSSEAGSNPNRMAAEASQPFRSPPPEYSSEAGSNPNRMAAEASAGMQFEFGGVASDGVVGSGDDRKKKENTLIKLTAQEEDALGLRICQGPIDVNTGFGVDLAWKSTSFDRMQGAMKAIAVGDTSFGGYIYHPLLGHEVEVQVVRNTQPHLFGAPGLPELNASQALDCALSNVAVVQSADKKMVTETKVKKTGTIIVYFLTEDRIYIATDSRLIFVNTDPIPGNPQYGVVYTDEATKYKDFVNGIALLICGDYAVFDELCRHLEQQLDNTKDIHATATIIREFLRSRTEQPQDTCLLLAGYCQSHERLEVLRLDIQPEHMDRPWFMDFFEGKSVKVDVAGRSEELALEKLKQYQSLNMVTYLTPEGAFQILEDIVCGIILDDVSCGGAIRKYEHRKEGFTRSRFDEFIPTCIKALVDFPRNSLVVVSNMKDYQWHNYYVLQKGILETHSVEKLEISCLGTNLFGQQLFVLYFEDQTKCIEMLESGERQKRLPVLPEEQNGLKRARSRYTLQCELFGHRYKWKFVVIERVHRALLDHLYHQWSVI